MSRIQLLVQLILVAAAVPWACSPTADSPVATQDVPAAAVPSTIPPAPEPAIVPANATAPLKPDDYTISVTPSVLSDGKVKLEIETNIPGTIEVMADLSLSNQKPDDIAIGKTERVRIIDGKGEVTFTTSDLPRGHYESEVSFYPRWGFQDAASRATGIDRQIDATTKVGSLGSGATAAEVQDLKSGQKWVMLNVNPDQRWDASEWINRFGSYTELEVHELNPAIIKAYYFPRIDTTIFVNTLKGEISHWRLGQAHR